MSNNIPFVSNGDPTIKQPYPDAHRLPILSPTVCTRIRLRIARRTRTTRTCLCAPTEAGSEAAMSSARAARSPFGRRMLDCSQREGRRTQGTDEAGV